MKYKALDVARYVIEYCKDRGYIVSNLKLQKILYFIQAEFLVNKNDVCFDDRIEAWDFGPVVPRVYQEYKCFGSNNIITRRREEIDIEANDRNMINGIVDVCAGYSATELVDITHRQTPWIAAYDKFQNNEISNESIKNFFREN